MSVETARQRKIRESSDEGGSQAVKAQQRLRELVLTGKLAAGSRIAELTLVDLLGVSRTPIRTALMRLEQEGLLDVLPSGGFAVRTFSERDVSEAIELRGTLEGLAARLAAERGVSARDLSAAKSCLDDIDTLLANTGLSDEMFSDYVRLNAQFHRLLSQMPGSAVLTREIERVGNLPFASPSGFVGVHLDDAPARDMLVAAQYQHRQVLDAIERREGARAEALMREHSRIAQNNMQLALQQPGTFALPGVQLIRTT